MPTLVYRKRGRPNAFVFGVQDIPITIGRHTDCVVVAECAGVSRLHAEVFTEDEGSTWIVRDLDSSNGTFLNGERIQTALLVDRDVLACGEFLVEFRRGPGSGRMQIDLHTEELAGTRSKTGGVAKTSSREFSVEEPEPQAVQAPVDVDTAPEETVPYSSDADVSHLFLRIHALEARNRALEEELSLMRDTLYALRAGRSMKSVELEMPGEASPTFESLPKEEPSGDDAFSQLLENVPTRISAAVASMMDLDRRRNAVLERLLGTIAQLQDPDADSGQDES